MKKSTFVSSVAMSVCAMLLAGCGLAETGAVAATQGASAAEQVKQGKEAQAKIEQGIEDAQQAAAVTQLQDIVARPHGIHRKNARRRRSCHPACHSRMKTTRRKRRTGTTWGQWTAYRMCGTLRDSCGRRC